jgi:NDP-sugar pyrophosphorylase family protein
MKTVAILAAGQGSRLGPKTKFFPKALVKIGDKAAISHIIEYFPKEGYKFVIAVGHLGHLVKQYVKIAHPDISVSFVDAEKPEGPGYALEKCRSNIPGEFYIWNCDTLVECGSIGITEMESVNWIGYSPTDSKDNEYSSLQTMPAIPSTGPTFIEAFHEKGENYTGNAYIGCAFIKDYENFWDGMKYRPVVIGNQYQVSAGFNLLLDDNKPVLGFYFKWFDTGNLEALQKTKEHFKGKIENLDKEDEEIYFFDGYVVKYFFNEKVAENRAKRNLTLGDTVPKLIAKDKNFYSYEYIEGKDLFCVENPEDYVADLFKFMQDNLWIEKKLSPEQCSQFHEACVDFYYRKTKSRVEQLFSKLHMYDSETIINGETVPKVFDLLSVASWKTLLNGTPTLMHGDFNFSNVLLTENGFKLIDWRQDFGGIIEFGDMYYDLAKFYSGLLFPHDVVKNKQYEISVKDKKVDYKIENCNSQSLTGKYKKSFVKMLLANMRSEREEGRVKFDLNKVKQLAALVLINMAPLHEYPLNILLFYQGKHELWQALKK